MPTSNSTNYQLNGLEVITSAFEMIGVAKGGEDLDPDDSATALRTLNVMLKALQQKLNIWKRKTATINLTLNQYIYTIGQKSAGNATSIISGALKDSGANFNTDNVQVGDTVLNIASGTSTTVGTVVSTTELGLTSSIFTLGTEAYEITDAHVSAPRPMGILECNRKDADGNEINMNVLTRNEFENLPNKTTTGTPLSYHYDPTITNGTFYIWQAPDTNAVSDLTIEIVYHATIEDVDTVSDIVDIPSEYYEALITGLAYRLSWRFGGLTAVERQSLSTDAQIAIGLAEGYDQEEGSLYAYPETRENY